MSATKPNPFPLLDGRELTDLPARVWMECVKCWDSSGTGPDVDKLAWAKQHAEDTWHTKFRLASQVNFSVEDPVFPQTRD